MVFLKSYPYIPRTILGEIPVPQEPGIVSSVDMYRYFFHVKDMTYYPYFKILVFHYQPSSSSVRQKVISDAELENGDKLFAKYGVYPKKPEAGYLCSGYKLDSSLSKLIKKVESQACLPRHKRHAAAIPFPVHRKSVFDLIKTFRIVSSLTPRKYIG